MENLEQKTEEEEYVEKGNGLFIATLFAQAILLSLAGFDNSKESREQIISKMRQEFVKLYQDFDNSPGYRAFAP
ncbi:MAG: hypothetical protein N3D20_00390 [Candidatus Pacearchaeota archaeon]|nr:hypothetical protein [Candidatus Pacearchaeota archaeon]